MNLVLKSEVITLRAMVLSNKVFPCGRNKGPVLQIKNCDIM